MKNQLFRISPDLQFTKILLQMFGIKDINDNHSFTRLNLIDLKTVTKMEENIEELKKYYIPCKANKYLYGLNENEVKNIMKNNIKEGSYKAWRKRVKNFSNRREYYK